MFEKLFNLVKSNAGTAVINNPAIPVKFHDAAINEASSSIIEVLKGQMENGKINDLVKYFRFSDITNNSLVASMVTKFAGKLNNFYDVEPQAAVAAANSLIPPVMKELVIQSKNTHNKDFSLPNLLSKLNGNRADLSSLVNYLMVA